MQLSPAHFLKETDVPLLPLLLNIFYLDEDSFYIIWRIIIPRWGVGGPFSINIGRFFFYLSGSVSLEINTCVLESRTVLIVSIGPSFFSFPLSEPVGPVFVCAFFFPSVSGRFESRWRSRSALKDLR